MADPTSLVPRPIDPRRARGVEKAAVLLMTLGAEAAAGVMKHLTEDEIHQLTTAIARLRSVPRAVAAAVNEEAWRRLTEREGFLVDGEGFARSLIGGGGKSPQQIQAMRDIERAAKTGKPPLSTRFESVGPQVLGQVISKEHPQVIALIIANLRPRQGADVLAALPEALQADIVHRLTDLQHVSDEILGELGDLIQAQVQGLGSAAQAVMVEGGAKLAAEILNVAPKAVEARVFSELETEAPEVAETIRQLMFTFEDMISLENRDMQLVLKEVARDDLMLALKTASPAMKDKIFKNISARAAEILEEDMGSMGAVKLKDVERAQSNIVAVVRRLEGEQKITLAGGGDDVVV
jgi:flagellar motor switch protein FliG